MKQDSKCAIYKIKLVEPKNGTPFYNAILCENVRNSKKRKGGNWECVFYPAYIFDMDNEYEPADFSLKNDEKNKYSFTNIANPEKSVIRIQDFSFDKMSRWDVTGYKQIKTESNQPIYDEKFYIYKCVMNDTNYKSETKRLKEALEEIEQLKNKLVEQKEHIKQAVKEKVLAYRDRCNNTINELKEQYELEISELKEAHKEQLKEKAEEIRSVKKMKKDEVIQNAIDFDLDKDFDFGDIE